MVGPNYHPPIEPMPEAFIEDRTVESDPLTEEDLAHWWTYFDDPFMEELLAESLQGNFDLLIAVEKIYQARAAFWVQATNILPELDSDLQVVRTRTSETLAGFSLLPIPPIQNFYQTGLDLIWQIDVFGGLRRAARSAYNTWEAQVESAQTVRILLLSEVAATYTNICALQKITEIASQIVQLDHDLLALAIERFEAGLTNEQEVETAEANLGADCAALMNNETSLKQAIYSLSILLGRPPESFVAQFLSSRPIPSALGRVPVGLPSDLLRRRPDIRSAERQIAAAAEQIGVAVAALFPQLSLTGSSGSFSSNPLQGANFGFASNSFKKWFTAPSTIWGFGGLITWPLFDFGKRLATVDIDVSLEHQALLSYEKTVIGALQEVESDLAAYFNEEERVVCLKSEEEANRRNYELAIDLYQAGLTSYTEALQAKQLWLLSLNVLTASQQALTTDLITLYQALGGGWECYYTP